MDRKRRWQIVDRQKAAYRRSMTPVFMRAFDKQIQPLYDRIQVVSDIRDIEMPPLDNQAINDAYHKLYQVTAVDYAKAKRKQWQQTRKKEGDDEIFEDLIMQEIVAYLQKHAGSTVVAAGDTSITLIENLLKKLTPEIVELGLGAGEAQTMLRDQIASAWHEAKYYRTERIVRTEVNRASNWGSLQGSKSLALEMNKVWLSAYAANSREEHTAADGQKVDLNESFIVWGETLDFPGDPAGSAENTINCLCGFYEELK